MADRLYFYRTPIILACRSAREPRCTIRGRRPHPSEALIMFNDLRYRLRALFRRRARLAFGGLDRVKEESREARGIVLLETIIQDLRYAVRGLVAKPGFTLGVVLTLGLGIGANAAMFGIVDRLLFRPPALLRDVEHVHRPYLFLTQSGVEEPRRHLQFARYLDVVRGTTSFSAAAAFQVSRRAVGTGEASREMNVGAVSASFFDFFDAPPVLGRYFTADEDRVPDGAAV